MTKLLPVFVYGTLKKGHSNHPLLADSTFLGAGAVPGELYDLGGIPGYIYKDVAATVKGEVYRMPWIGTLYDLDILEGEGYLYERIVVNATLNSGDKVDVWVYQYMNGSMGLKQLKNGVWP